MITVDFRKLIDPFDSKLREYLYEATSGLAHGSYTAILENDELSLYSLVFICSEYLVYSHSLITIASSMYFKRQEHELFKNSVTIDIWTKGKNIKL